jgi:hypothetical protein
MRRITAEITRAFEERRTLKIDNSYTDGNSLWLFDNKIAVWRDGYLWITNALWKSKTTKERLNGLSGVNIRQERGVWYLNDKVWDGRWVNVWVWTYEREAVANEPEFDVTSEWVPKVQFISGAYSRPIYSVFHTWVQGKVKDVERILNEEGIPTKMMESDTDGEYKPNYFVVVRPEDVAKAVSILSESYCIA